MRYTGTIHKRVAPGGEQYIGVARTLLGMLEHRMKLAGLDQSVAYRVLPNGISIRVASVKGNRIVEISRIVQKRIFEEGVTVALVGRWFDKEPAQTFTGGYFVTIDAVDIPAESKYVSDTAGWLGFFSRLSSYGGIDWQSSQTEAILSFAAKDANRYELQSAGLGTDIYQNGIEIISDLPFNALGVAYRNGVLVAVCRDTTANELKLYKRESAVWVLLDSYSVAAGDDTSPFNFNGEGTEAAAIFVKASEVTTGESHCLIATVSGETAATITGSFSIVKSWLGMKKETVVTNTMSYVLGPQIGISAYFGPSTYLTTKTTVVTYSQSCPKCVDYRSGVRIYGEVLFTVVSTTVITIDTIVQSHLGSGDPFTWSDITREYQEYSTTNNIDGTILFTVDGVTICNLLRSTEANSEASTVDQLTATTVQEFILSYATNIQISRYLEYVDLRVDKYVAILMDGSGWNENWHFRKVGVTVTIDTRTLTDADISASGELLTNGLVFNQDSENRDDSGTTGLSSVSYNTALYNPTNDSVSITYTQIIENIVSPNIPSLEAAWFYEGATYEDNLLFSCSLAPIDVILTNGLGFGVTNFTDVLYHEKLYDGILEEPIVVLPVTGSFVDRYMKNIGLGYTLEGEILDV